ncbi:MAG: hypothetical protein WC878_04945 [Candidatus Paceibacterota bacterium]|jgi:hypothetical protein
MVKKYVFHHEEIQIVFKSDPNLKDAALEKAKQEGMTLKAILCSAMRAYVNDELVMGMTRREEHYEEEDGPPKTKAPPEKKEKIKSGIKSPVRNIESIKKKNSRKISNS